MIVVMLVRRLQELRLDVEDAVEVERIAAEHLVDPDFRALGAMQPRIRIDAADARLDFGEFGRRDQIGLVDEDDVGKGDLVLRLGRILEPVLEPFGVGDGDDRIQLGLAPTFSSMKNVCATGAGSASPVVSTMMASNLPLRRISPSMMRTRSPRTVQQMQPLFISNTSSSALTTSSLSMPISPNSLTMTANFLPCGSDRMRLSSVVLPAPR